MSGSDGAGDSAERLIRELQSGDLVSLTLSSPADATQATPLRVRPIELQSGLHWQWTFPQGRQHRHENLTPEQSLERLGDLFPHRYRHVHARLTASEVDARVSKRGKLFLSRRSAPRVAVSAAHNRRREYVIPGDEPCPFLEAIGVMTREGRVRASQQHKFRQINRYLELVRDVLPHLPGTGTLSIVDFGCGKSGLTFALHHLLTKVHHRSVDMIGLDRNPDVIATCCRVASELGLEGLRFETGDIADHQAAQVHLAVSLHACDTATDDALAQAVNWSADVILAVPCCQHELSRQIESAALAPLLKHGILRERLASDATDALRAAALEIAGYRTQIVEFIELEHTPKNLLIRAIKGSPPVSRSQRKRLLESYSELKRTLGVSQFTLETRLQASGRLDEE